MAINKEAVQQFLCSQWVQKALLIVFITACFWDGLWGGVPRADQVIYLHRIQQYENFFDIITNSISWNRTGDNPGDVLLFRPVLFMQMGIFFYLFKYNFFAWQLASLILHICSVLTLHSIFFHGVLRKSVFPVLISALFGCAFFSSELVYWSHISGYLTYSLLFLLQILFIIKFFKADGNKFWIVSVIFGVLAEFTYELGVIQNALIFIVFLCRYFSLPQGNFKILKVGIFFALAVIVYPVISYADLVINGVVFTHDAQSKLSGTFWLGVVYSIQELIFWFRGLCFPNHYQVAALDRASLMGESKYDLIFWISIFVASGVFWLALLCAKLPKLKYGSFVLNQYGILAAGGVFLFLYSAVISFGRALPRGIDYVFNSNIYYAYIAYAILFTTIAVCSCLECQYKLEPEKNKNNLKSSCVYCGFILLLIATNCYSTKNLGFEFRYYFSNDKSELLSRVQKITSNNSGKTKFYYAMEKNCVALPPLPWLSSHIREPFKGFRTPPTLADALFPDYSLMLNEQRLIGQPAKVIKIDCENVKVSSQLGSYDGNGLMSAEQPGWHAATPLVFPQEIQVNFGETRKIKAVRLLFQDNFISRGPRHVDVMGDDGNNNLIPVVTSNLDCESESSVWRNIFFKEAIAVNRLKLVIRSNCGDPHLLTLRGLKFID